MSIQKYNDISDTSQLLYNLLNC